MLVHGNIHMAIYEGHSINLVKYCFSEMAIGSTVNNSTFFKGINNDRYFCTIARYKYAKYT